MRLFWNESGLGRKQLSKKNKKPWGIARLNNTGNFSPKGKKNQSESDDKSLLRLSLVCSTYMVLGHPYYETLMVAGQALLAVRN